MGETIGPEANGSKFKCVHFSLAQNSRSTVLYYSVGDLLRFSTMKNANQNGPQPPPSALNTDPQGTLIEIKDGTMRVAFDEYWSLEDSLYRYALFPRGLSRND